MAFPQHNPLKKEKKEKVNNEEIKMVFSNGKLLPFSFEFYRVEFLLLILANLNSLRCTD